MALRRLTGGGCRVLTRIMCRHRSKKPSIKLKFSHFLIMVTPMSSFVCSQVKQELFILLLTCLYIVKNANFIYFYNNSTKKTVEL